MSAASVARPRLVWIGSPFFSHALEACGWDVRLHNFEDARILAWEDIAALADGEPDAVVVADKSRPPFVLGQENFPCPTVFYAVDTHIHSWLPFYAQSFDLCLVSLRDHRKRFLNQRLPDEQVIWSPPYARSDKQPGAMPHVWPCLFVGSVNSSTPKRAQFIEAFQAEIPDLHVTRGAYETLYPQADVVLNISERGDLNFRVFEALGCGACLVTPHVGHGLDELFTDGRHLALYSELDAGEACTVVRGLLADPERRARMATEGLAEVNAKHRDIHRAEALTAVLRGLPNDTVQARRATAPFIRKTWLKAMYLLFAESIPYPRLRKAYLDAAVADKR